MRFTKQKEIREAWENNQDKIINKFLLFPVTIDGETRWLEKATIVLRADRLTDAFDYSNHRYYWYYHKFID